MDFAFDYELEVGGWCAGEVTGTAVISGGRSSWTVDEIEIDVCQWDYEHKGPPRLVRKAVKLDQSHHLYEPIKDYLVGYCAPLIRAAFDERRECGGDPNAEHRTYRAGAL